MLTAFSEMWAGLSASGKTVVLVVLILAITGLLAMAMWLGYRLDWLPDLLGQAVSG